MASPKIKSKKRPKSIFTKGWETRRRNAAAKLVQVEAAKIASEMPANMTTDTTTDVLKQLAPMTTAHPSPMTLNQDTANDNAKRHSEVWAVAATLRMQRDEQLACFLGDISAIRQMPGGMKGHFPVMISRSQVEAIEEFLSDHGYSPFGRSRNRVRDHMGESNAKATKA